MHALHSPTTVGAGVLTPVYRQPTPHTHPAAYALAWAMWLLATHPGAQAKARAEAQAAFAQVPAGGGEDDEECVGFF